MTFDGEYLHGDLFSMAAAYAFHIAEAQAFVDGRILEALPELSGPAMVRPPGAMPHGLPRETVLVR